MRRVVVVVVSSLLLAHAVLLAGAVGLGGPLRGEPALAGAPEVQISQAGAPGPSPAVTREESYVGSAFTIDMCQIRPNRQVWIGGHVGPDSLLGVAVTASRGTRVVSLGNVRDDGTFQGETPDDFAATGQTVSVSIRPRGGTGAWVYTCRVEAGPTESNPVAPPVRAPGRE